LYLPESKRQKTKNQFETKRAKLPTSCQASCKIRVSPHRNIRVCTVQM